MKHHKPITLHTPDENANHFITEAVV